MYKTTFNFIACLFLCLILQVAPVRAETKIAVVDVQKLLTESQAAQSIHSQIEKYRAQFLEEFSKQEQMLRQKEKELNDLKGSVAPEELAQKKNDFEQDMLKTRRDAQARKVALDRATAEAGQKLRSSLVKVVQAIADEKGYNLVISSEDVIVGERTLDISEETMERINKEIQKISLNIDSP